MRNLSALVDDVRSHDVELGAELELAVRRLTTTAEAMIWSQEQLPALLASTTTTGVLREVAACAEDISNAPRVFAIAFEGTPSSSDDLSVRAVIGPTDDADAATELSDVSRSVIARVAQSGRPEWSDDALSEARFSETRSVHALGLRSVGCIPIGGSAALYVSDPTSIGRFGRDLRLRLSALCSVAGLVLRSHGIPAPPAPQVDAIPGIIGTTPAMRELAMSIRAFAPMPWPVLIMGETGTGKELVARAIHDLSVQSDKPFVAVNCGAIPETLAESTLFGHERGAFTGADRRREGVFERVAEGTLFLDEIGELPADVQSKLLRVLQDRRFERVGGNDALRFRGRLVSATHQPVDQADARGSFREDLYHRLSACVIRTPPLRERRDDIAELAGYLLEGALAELPGAPDLTLSPAAIASLQSESWPGNVRQLENVLRGAVARTIATRASRIDPAHLGLDGGPRFASEAPGVGLKEATDAFQRAMIDRALDRTDGNRSRAAEELGVSRQWLHRLLKRWEDGDE